jgi:hypothetical protein
MESVSFYVVHADIFYARDKVSCEELYTVGCEESTWAREAEETPLLEAAAREQLVKTQQAVKRLREAVVIYEFWGD